MSFTADSATTTPDSLFAAADSGLAGAPETVDPRLVLPGFESVQNAARDTEGRPRPGRVRLGRSVELRRPGSLPDEPRVSAHD